MEPGPYTEAILRGGGDLPGAVPWQVGFLWGGCSRGAATEVQMHGGTDYAARQTPTSAMTTVGGVKPEKRPIVPSDGNGNFPLFSGARWFVGGSLDYYQESGGNYSSGEMTFGFTHLDPWGSGYVAGQYDSSPVGQMFVFLGGTGRTVYYARHQGSTDTAASATFTDSTSPRSQIARAFRVTHHIISFDDLTGTSGQIRYYINGKLTHVQSVSSLDYFSLAGTMTIGTASSATSGAAGALSHVWTLLQSALNDDQVRMLHLAWEDQFRGRRRLM